VNSTFNLKITIFHIIVRVKLFLVFSTLKVSSGKKVHGNINENEVWAKKPKLIQPFLSNLQLNVVFFQKHQIS